MTTSINVLVPRPVVSSLLPAAGPLGGKTKVTITGSYLTG